MERLKLVYSTIEKTLNINYIMDRKFLSKLFPLHDSYELKGQS